MSRKSVISVSRLNAIQELLEDRFSRYNTTAFIATDPISIPHRFTRLQDIEIAGLLAATLAWGQRKTIVSKCEDLLQRMDGAPYEFIRNHTDNDLKGLTTFCHRTFNGTDLLYFVYVLRNHYSNFNSLEDAFLAAEGAETVEPGLVQFYKTFFNQPEVSERTRKHVATPERGSACKRLNMYLRWMVRHDSAGVDFGIWKRLQPRQLVCPLDVHVSRVARKLRILKRKRDDWQAALELTLTLRRFDPVDPVKYDYALFGLGVVEKWA